MCCFLISLRDLRNNWANWGHGAPGPWGFEPFRQAETLAVLGEKLEDVHLSAFQPCGKAWQAAITCGLDHRDGEMAMSGHRGTCVSSDEFMGFKMI